MRKVQVVHLKNVIGQAPFCRPQLPTTLKSKILSDLRLLSPPHPTHGQKIDSCLPHPHWTERLVFPARFASNCRVLIFLPIQSVHVSDWAKLLACGDASGEVETVNLRKKQSAKFVSLITCVPTVSFRLQTLGLYIKEGVFGRLITGGAYIRGGI